MLIASANRSNFNKYLVFNRLKLSDSSLGSVVFVSSIESSANCGSLFRSANVSALIRYSFDTPKPDFHSNKAFLALSYCFNDKCRTVFNSYTALLSSSLLLDSFCHRSTVAIASSNISAEA